MYFMKYVFVLLSVWAVVYTISLGIFSLKQKKRVESVNAFLLSAIAIILCVKYITM